MNDRSGPPAPRRQFSPEEMDRVIRRAVELQFAHSEREAHEGVDEGELLRIGSEVGIDSRHLRRALGELRAEAMVPDAPADGGVFRKLGGEGFVRVARAVPREPKAVAPELERHFVEREALTAIRKRPEHSLWEPAGGFLANVQRGLNWGGGSYHLAKAASIELLLTPLEDGFTLVSLTADLRNQRSEHVGGSIGVIGFFGGAGGLGLGFALGAPLLAAPALLGSAWAGARFGQSEYRKQVRRIRLAMEGILDRLETGEPLSPPPSKQLRFLHVLRE